MPCTRDPGRRHRPRSALTLGLATGSSGSRRSGSATRRHPARAGLRGRQPRHRGEGKHLRFRIRQSGRDALGDRVRARRPARPAPATRPPRSRLPPEGEPVERDRRAAARRAQALRRARRLRGATRPARRGLAGGRGRLDAEAHTIFAELRLAPRGRAASSTSRRRFGRCSRTQSRTRFAPPSDARRERRGGTRRVPCRVVERDERARELACSSFAAAGREGHGEHVFSLLTASPARGFLPKGRSTLG